MLCEECGHEITESSGFCPTCGTAVGGTAPPEPQTSSAGLAPAATAAAPASASHREQKRGSPLLGRLALAVVVTISFLAHFAFTGGNLPASLGAATGTVLLPGIFVALYYRRKTPPPGRKSLVLAGWATVMLLVSLNGQLQRTKNQLNEDDVSQLMQEALGKRPVQDRNNQQKQLIRHFFARVKELNARQAKTASELQVPADQLLSPSSFRDRATMKHMIAYLNAMRALDQGQEQALVGVTDDLRAEVNAADWPSSERQAFLTGLEKGLAQAMELRRGVLEAEIKWLDSVEAVYTFTLQNQKHISVPNGKVIIDSDPVLATYNERIEGSERLRTEFLGKGKAFEKRQSELLSNMGVSLQDFGVSVDK